MSPTTFAQAIYRDIRGRRTEPRSDEKHQSATIDWLYRSQDVTGCGGSAANYNLITGWAGPYPETSGYIIPTLYDYAEYSDSKEARERANQMGQWLLLSQLESGAFPGGVNPGPRATPSVFNTGQILLGLVRTYQETGNDEFQEAIVRAGRWLVEVQHENGYWDRYDYQGEVHSYSSRVAWALLKAKQETGIDEFGQAAISNLDWVVSQQTSELWFKNAGFSSTEKPFLHTIAYTVRGLLEGGLILDDTDYIEAAKATANFLLKLRIRDGPLDGAFDGTWTGADFYCLTGNAQMAFIWLELFDLYGDARYIEIANQEITFLKRKHILNGPSEIYGAVKGSDPVWGPYLRFRFPNWAAKFFLDCLLHPHRTT